MITFNLVTLNGVKFGEQVYEVLLPTLDGIIGVMPGHMPLVSVATNGQVSIRRRAIDRDDAMEHFAISGGVIEVSNDVLSLLVDDADNADDISEAEAKAAMAEAEKLKREAKDQVSLAKAQDLIDRQAVRLQVAGLKRRRPRA